MYVAKHVAKQGIISDLTDDVPILVQYVATSSGIITLKIIVPFLEVRISYIVS